MRRRARVEFQGRGRGLCSRTHTWGCSFQGWVQKLRRCLKRFLAVALGTSGDKTPSRPFPHQGRPSRLSRELAVESVDLIFGPELMGSGAVSQKKRALPVTWLSWSDAVCSGPWRGVWAASGTWTYWQNHRSHLWTCALGHYAWHLTMTVLPVPLSLSGHSFAGDCNRPKSAWEDLWSPLLSVSVSHPFTQTKCSEKHLQLKNAPSVSKIQKLGSFSL